MPTNFFSPLSFVAVFGSGKGKNQDPGSGINIPDRNTDQHSPKFLIFKPNCLGQVSKLWSERSDAEGELEDVLSQVEAIRWEQY